MSARDARDYDAGRRARSPDRRYHPRSRSRSRSHSRSPHDARRRGRDHRDARHARGRSRSHSRSRSRSRSRSPGRGRGRESDRDYRRGMYGRHERASPPAGPGVPPPAAPAPPGMPQPPAPHPHPATVHAHDSAPSAAAPPADPKAERAAKLAAFRERMRQQQQPQPQPQPPQPEAGAAAATTAAAAVSGDAAAAAAGAGSAVRGGLGGGTSAPQAGACAGVSAAPTAARALSQPAAAAATAALPVLSVHARAHAGGAGATTRAPPSASCETAAGSCRPSGSASVRGGDGAAGPNGARNGDAGSDAGITAAAAAGAASAAAPEDGANVEDDDPLDAYMRTSGLLAQAQADVEASAQREAAELAGKPVADISRADALDPDFNPLLHCYICKQRGHTKKDCPVRRCRHCGEPGHQRADCPAFQEQLESEATAEKAKKRQAFYAKKKERRKEEWVEHLRAQTGIEGFEVLYRILGLPERRLATKAQITKAYHKLSLKYHPDKTASLGEEEREAASEKFLAVKTAYDLLCEGMENGGKGFGGAVFSAGDIEARFSSATGVGLSEHAERAAASFVAPAPPQPPS